MTSVLDQFRLDGRVALVTGAHSWLGWDIACALAEAGAHVAITSRETERAEEAAGRLAELYPAVDTRGIALDQTDPKAVVRCFDELWNWKTRLDILVNNAGGGSGSSDGNIATREVSDIDSMIRTNLTGVIYCCREASRLMSRRKSGVMINLGSIAGLVGRDRTLYRESGVNEQPVDYAAVKAGVIGLSRDLAASLGPQGIRVNTISPGGFDKGQLPDSFVSGYGDRTVLGGMGRMGVDIKGAALFLASDASAYVTGHNLVVDGGFSVFK